MYTHPHKKTTSTTENLNIPNGLTLNVQNLFYQIPLGPRQLATNWNLILFSNKYFSYLEHHDLNPLRKRKGIVTGAKDEKTILQLAKKPVGNNQTVAVSVKQATKFVLRTLQTTGDLKNTYFPTARIIFPKKGICGGNIFIF